MVQPIHAYIDVFEVQSQDSTWGASDTVINDKGDNVSHDEFVKVLYSQGVLATYGTSLRELVNVVDGVQQLRANLNFSKEPLEKIKLIADAIKKNKESDVIEVNWKQLWRENKEMQLSSREWGYILENMKRAIREDRLEASDELDIEKVRFVAKNVGMSRIESIMNDMDMAFMKEFRCQYLERGIENPNSANQFSTDLWLWLLEDVCFLSKGRQPTFSSPLYEKAKSLNIFDGSVCRFVKVAGEEALKKAIENTLIDRDELAASIEKMKAEHCRDH